MEGVFCKNPPRFLSKSLCWRKFFSPSARRIELPLPKVDFFFAAWAKWGVERPPKLWKRCLFSPWLPVTTPICLYFFLKPERLEIWHIVSDAKPVQTISEKSSEKSPRREFSIQRGMKENPRPTRPDQQRVPAKMDCLRREKETSDVQKISKSCTRGYKEVLFGSL